MSLECHCDAAPYSYQVMESKSPLQGTVPHIHVPHVTELEFPCFIWFP